MQPLETRLCCQLSLMFCLFLMEEDVCGFLSPYPWDNWAVNWDSSSFWSETAENRPPPGSSSFLHHTDDQPDNGFGGASSWLILAQKKLKPAKFLYSLIPVWDTAAGCVSLFPIQGCLCAMHLVEMRQSGASVPIQLTQISDCFLQFQLGTVTLCNSLELHFLQSLSSTSLQTLCVPLLPPSGHL